MRTAVSTPRATVNARRSVGVLAACFLGALVLLAMAAGPAWAHTVTIGQSKIRQDGEAVGYELAVNYDQLAKRIAAIRPSGPPPYEATDAELEAALRGGKDELEAYLGPRVRVYLDGVECDGSLETVGAQRHRGELYGVMSLAFQCPGSPSGRYEVGYDLFFDALSVAERAAHANVADYELGSSAGRFVFEPGDQRLVAGGSGPFASAGRFVVLGFEHILGGLDHVLFVLALLLGARSATSVLKTATAFTAAHSVTLALAAMGWVHVSPSIVEPLIAASIAYVAVENIIREDASHRLLVVFGFGLLHGLGFAGTLRFTDQVSWRLVASLFTFNVGIELGQALIILLAFPLLLLARRLQWSRLAQLAASGLIAGFGVVWLLQRLPFA